MLDINKGMENLEADGHDPDGNMVGLPTWSPEFAQQQALEEGLGELSETQWHVIYALRNLHRVNGRADSARQVIGHLEQDFADEGGRRTLNLAFPLGPVNQGSRLAGVPVPPYTTDPSFGSVI